MPQACFAVKKPVRIEFFVFDGTDNDLPEWAKPVCTLVSQNGVPFMKVETLERTVFASVGDRIIRGAGYQTPPLFREDIYPCKPDIFEATYMVVAEDARW